MVDVRHSFGFICTGEDVKAVQRRPEPEEQVVIDDYRDAYTKAMQRAPHGLHYLVFPGVPDTVAVWLPLET
jgi:hypothetical protein